MTSILGSGPDISEKCRTETHTQNQQKAALAGQMAAGVAHELLNPLGAISGAVQILRQQSVDPTTQTIYDEIKAQIDRISRTLRQMLDLARPVRNEPRACRINDLLTTIVDLLRFDRRSNRVQIALDLDDRVPATLAVEDSLTQVFMNLAVNALDAMDSDRSETPRRLSVKSVLLEADGGSVIRISFEDSGPGISPEVVDRIFEPYFTTKGPGKGTGLGLLVSKRILENHQGTLRVDPRFGKGARLIMDLPVQDPHPR